MIRPDSRRHDPRPQYIRKLIAQSGLSQQAAAAIVGVSDRMMRSYCSSADRYDAPYAIQYALEALAKFSSEENLEKITARFSPAAVLDGNNVCGICMAGSSKRIDVVVSDCGESLESVRMKISKAKPLVATAQRLYAANEYRPFIWNGGIYYRCARAEQQNEQ